MGNRGPSEDMAMNKNPKPNPCIKTKMNKKAQLFTAISILLITLMFVTFEVYSTINERNAIKTRISTMNGFLDSVEKNLERQVFISGFRIIFLAENQITATGNYINVESFFNESFFNGTINGIPNDLMLGATYGDLINSLNEKANKINVNVTLKNTRINISQENPWSVKFVVELDLFIEDQGHLASWERKQEIAATIPIVGFEDPIYTINTYARISKKINQTIYEDNYIVDGDSSNLLDHVENDYYAENPSAPSFLKRLEGDLSADPNGIESFVRTPELSQQGLSIKTKSTIDYIYFSSNNPTYSQVSGMPSWFYLDNNHFAKYNVTG